MDERAQGQRGRRPHRGPHCGRIDRLAEGNPGDVRPVGEGVSELRLHHGPGYRVYFVHHAADIVLLSGGTKKTQSKDIRSALRMAREL